MERQTRNIALLALFIAALGSVAITGAEQHRSPTNTLILVIAATAAVGSLLALVLGSIWFGVLEKDVREWWEGRPRRRWSVRHYPAEEPEPNVIDLDMAPSEAHIRAEGMPCTIVALQPRTLGIATERPMRGVAVSCTIERRDRRAVPSQAVRLTPHGDDAWGVIARWPDQWFDAEHEGPAPGDYRVRWQLRHPDGRIERRTEKVRVLAEGRAHVGRLTRAVNAARAFVRHYRGLDT